MSTNLTYPPDICPPNNRLPFLDTQKSYKEWAYAVFVLSTIINGYTIYCICYRSPKEMGIYRWYLLAHQIVAYLADSCSSLILHVISIAPFMMIKVDGLLSHIINCRHAFSLSAYGLTLSMFTMFLMVIFRYFLAKRYTDIPRGIKYFLICSAICGSPIEIFFFEQSNDPNELDLVKGNYSCVAISLQNETNVCAFTSYKIGWFIFIPIFGGSFLLVCSFFIMTLLAYRAINIKTISAKSKRLQRLYMLQIILQFTLPVLLFVIPLSSLPFYSSVTQTNYDTLYTILSLYSTIGAIVLIVMNRNYHIWLFNRKKTKMATVVGSNVSSQVRSNEKTLEVRRRSQITLSSANSRRK